MSAPRIGSTVRRAQPALVALVAAGLLLGLPGPSGGCSASQTNKKTAGQAAQTFHDDVRWQRFRAASRRVHPSIRDQWLADMERVARVLKVTEFELRPVEAGAERVVYDVDISYYRQDVMVLQVSRRRQVWTLVGGAWLLESEREVAIPKVGDDPMTLPELGPTEGEDHSAP